MSQLLHRHAQILLRGILVAFLLAFTPAALGQTKPTDCPACADLVKALNEAKYQLNQITEELSRAYASVEELSARSSLASDERAQLERLKELKLKLSQRALEQDRKIDSLSDQLKKCLEKNCPKLLEQRPGGVAVPEVKIPEVKACPACAAQAAALTTALRTEAYYRSLVDSITVGMESYTDKAMKGPVSAEDQHAYEGLRRALEEYQRSLNEWTSRVQLARSALADCEKKNCSPPSETTTPPATPGGGTTLGGGTTPGTGPKPGAGVKCPGCLDKAKQLADKQAELAALEKSLDAVSTKLKAISNKFIDNKATQKDQDDYRTGIKEAGDLDGKIKAANEAIDKLNGELKGCEKEKCPPPSGAGMLPGSKDLFGATLGGPLVKDKLNFWSPFQVESVNNVQGNNPFNAQNPLGGFAPSTVTLGCASPQPAPDTQVLSCPAGEAGNITQTRSYFCLGSSWTPGPYLTTSNTCASAPFTCTGSKPPPDTQVLSCPAGQVGLIVQARSYTCVGTTWTPGPYVTTSNTCAVPTPTGCATNFSTGNYTCSGQCGIASTSLGVTSGSNVMTASPFGANSNVNFTCLGANALSQSNNLIILGAPGHTCSLSGMTLSAFGVTCQNSGGGRCASSCSR